MTWTMLIIAIIAGTFTSSDVRFHSIPMLNKEACVRAATEASSKSSSQVGYICISSETGENIRFQK